MKTNSPKSASIVRMLQRIPLQKLSKESQFCKRRTKKITPKEFILGFFLMIYSPGRHSYQQWASKIGFLKGRIISKQALWKRMQPSASLFLEHVLAYVLTNSMKKNVSSDRSEKLKQFKNIIIEDSTHIKVHDNLADAYPGNGYWDKESRKAIIKLQVAYNLTKARFERLHITNFRKNDQGYAPEIIRIVRKGDLLLRDLGYFVLQVFTSLQEKGVFYISRLKSRTNLYLLKDDKTPIDLCEMLQKRGQLDISVFIGNEERVPIRLVALPVNETVAAERRRKAKTDRDRRMLPSKNKLYMLGWELFITNVAKDKLQASDIAALYFLRWRIETIFKCWKSHLQVQQVPHDANKTRLEVYMYCLLIFVVMVQVGIYRYYMKKGPNRTKSSVYKNISIMKLTKFIADNIGLIICIEYFDIVHHYRSLDRQIEYFCAYETRHDRLNFVQKLAS
jgi:hypothetical protein